MRVAQGRATDRLAGGEGACCSAAAVGAVPARAHPATTLDQPNNHRGPAPSVYVTSPPPPCPPTTPCSQLKNSAGEDVRRDVIVDPSETHELDGSRGTAHFCLKWDKQARHQVGGGVWGGARWVCDAHRVVIAWGSVLRGRGARGRCACVGVEAALQRSLHCPLNALRPDCHSYTLLHLPHLQSPPPPGLPEPGAGQGRDAGPDFRGRGGVGARHGV